MTEQNNAQTTAAANQAPANDKDAQAKPQTNAKPTTAAKPKSNAKPKAAADQKPPAKKMVEVIEVVGPAAGFRRAGHTFGKDPVQIPLSDLNEAKLAAIEGEPKLVSVRKEIEV